MINLSMFAFLWKIRRQRCWCVTGDLDWLRRNRSVSGLASIARRVLRGTVEPVLGLAWGCISVAPSLSNMVGKWECRAVQGKAHSSGLHCLYQMSKWLKALLAKWKRVYYNRQRLNNVTRHVCPGI